MGLQQMCNDINPIWVIGPSIYVCKNCGRKLIRQESPYIHPVLYSIWYEHEGEPIYKWNDVLGFLPINVSNR